MKIVKTFCAILCALFVNSMFANESIDEIVSIAIANNYELQSLEYQNISALQSSESENVLSNPEVDFTHLWGTKDAGNKWQLSVSQSFEWPTVYSMRRNVNDATFQASQYLVLAKQNEIAFNIYNAVDQIVYNRRKLNTLMMLKNNLDIIEQKVLKGFNSGEISKIDVIKIQYAQFDIDNRISALSSEEITLNNQLTTLCGGQDVIYDSVSEYPQLILHPKAHYLSLVTQNPEILYYMSMSNVQNKVIDEAKSSKYPGFSVGYNHESELGGKFDGFSVGVTLPVFTGKKKQAAAQNLQLAYDKNVNQLYVNRSAEIEESFKKIENLNRQLTSAAQLFNNADYPELMRKAFEGGQISLIEYLMEVNYFLEASIQYLDLEYEYQQLLTTINKDSFIK